MTENPRTRRVVVERLVADRPARATIVDCEVVVGRAEECGLPVRERGVSRHHARLIPGPEGLEVHDLQSANGTFVNGRRLTRPTVARVGDVIRVGACLLRVSEVFSGPPRPPIPTPAPATSAAAAAAKTVVFRRVAVPIPEPAPTPVVRRWNIWTRDR